MKSVPDILVGQAKKMIDDVVNSKQLEVGEIVSILVGLIEYIEIRLDSIRSR